MIERQTVKKTVEWSKMFDHSSHKGTNDQNV